jgi:hypothetical protein
MDDVLRNALAEAQKRVGCGGRDGEGLRELAAVCVRVDDDDDRNPKKKKKNPNEPCVRSNE